ncbi:hypothetical protein HanXRQr2_Chr13g0616871 [Helianthus annuus]|uniref:Transposase, Ptta/En/Spm, plant n=1 Tax=Helianthus annuus TaxID=4232 RepID=A0A9K3HEI2_HELAN|nr:hypothetical protein HanXRQr2_Chr13g0616871 [Helianthus annuus]
MFSREVGIYMWDNLAFDRYSYTNVSAAEKNAMEQHLRRRFNFEEIERDCERGQLKGGIRSVYMKRYRDRKSMAKKEFIELGKRHDNLETIRGSPPTGMGVENWRKTIDLFGDPKYKKKNVEALETYAHAHTLPDGTFASPLEEENFGTGRKPSLSSASSDVSPHEKEKTRPQFSEEYFDELFEDPRFMERLYKAMDKKESRKGNENDTDEEGE